MAGSVNYMNIIIQQKKSRINIKRHGKIFKGSEAAFLALWKDKMTSQMDIRAHFKKVKLVLHNYRPDVEMRLSPDVNTKILIFRTHDDI